MLTHKYQREKEKHMYVQVDKYVYLYFILLVLLPIERTSSYLLCEWFVYHRTQVIYGHLSDGDRFFYNKIYSYRATFCYCSLSFFFSHLSIRLHQDWWTQIKYNDVSELIIDLLLNRIQHLFSVELCPIIYILVYVILDWTHVVLYNLISI